MMKFYFSPRNISILFFSIFFIAGVFIFRDYGLSWDEELNRIGTALPEYNYVFHGNKEALLESSEKYHGPAFELLLLASERLFNVTDTRPIYFLRHFITFFFFWLSTCALYLLGKKIFKSQWTPLLCVLMYVLSPRLFGEAFYNSKDIGFLSFFSISLFTLYRFIERKNLKSAIIHSLVTGFMIDIRITGLLIPFVTIIALIGEYISRPGEDNRWRKGAILSGLYVVIQFIFIVLFWPVLWMGPIHHLAEAFRQMSDYPWHGQMLFAGNIITDNSIPWYYLPLWIGITVPVFYCILCIAGAGLLLLRIFNLEHIRSTEGRFQLLLLALFCGPIILVVLFNSVIYDGWRHLYFVYAPFVLVSGIAIDSIYLRAKSAIASQVLTATLSLQFLFVIVSMMRDHPHQHVYFNPVARIVYPQITQQFDADYWGLSYRSGLEKLLTMDTSADIHIRVENDPGIFNLEMLTPEQRNRFSIHGDIHEVDYWLAEFRGRKVRPVDIPLAIVFQVKNSSGILLTCYKGLRSGTKREILFQQKENFDAGTMNNFSGPASSEKIVQMLGPQKEMTDPVSFIYGPVEQGTITEIQLNALVNSAGYNPKVLLVVSVMRGDTGVFWQAESFQNLINAKNVWTPLKWNVTFPQQTVREGDKISAFVWNTDKTAMQVKEFEMQSVVYYPPPESPYGFTVEKKD